MRTAKCVLKGLGIAAGLAGAAVGVYVLLEKWREKKLADGDAVESFVSCSCLDDDPIVVPEG